MGFVAFMIIAIVAILLLVMYWVAGLFGEIARDKGYDEETWKSRCFWSAFIGMNFILYIAVVALPDRVATQSQDKTNALLEENNRLLAEVVGGGATKPQSLVEDLMQEL